MKQKMTCKTYSRDALISKLGECSDMQQLSLPILLVFSAWYYNAYKEKKEEETKK